MGVFIYSDEYTSPISPARLFKAWFLTLITLPKLMPQVVKSVEFAQVKHVKNRIDAIDPENFSYTYSLVDGHGLLDKLETVLYETSGQGPMAFEFDRDEAHGLERSKPLLLTNLQNPISNQVVRIISHGCLYFTQEYTSPVAPSRMFKALILDSNILIPKLLPQFIKSVDVIQGSEGTGTIEQVNFTEASDLKYVKNRIEELDKDNLVCKYTLIEEILWGTSLILLLMRSSLRQQ
ncbi:hypothetical protein GH714_018400 [Hevea brasiliensis]|uniref:Bet v I/Major latex protein domain-containing protein n=1 Tax=Hevea brasiliensis TaxID=3981 RepID=A0A6A6MMW2_HEVBR|nr:hypothetical protein GH714_018400 [Hevea brasiliensis]